MQYDKMYKKYLKNMVDDGRKKTIECKRLSLLPEAIGSTKILLKAAKTERDTGQKINLSNKLGTGYSTN